MAADKRSGCVNGPRWPNPSNCSMLAVGHRFAICMAASMRKVFGASAVLALSSIVVKAPSLRSLATLPSMISTGQVTSGTRADASAAMGDASRKTFSSTVHVKLERPTQHALCLASVLPCGACPLSGSPSSLLHPSGGHCTSVMSMPLVQHMRCHT
jgi:hypothetical protein